MAVEKDEFFREVTLRICSSLQINIAFERAFEYLRDHFPIDHMFLDIPDKSLGATRRIAFASVGHRPPVEIVPLPEGVWEWLGGLRAPFILNASDADERIRTFAPLIKLEGCSDLSMPLRIEDELIGFLILRAKGEKRYTSDHMALLSVVVEPFAMALANALAHEAVVRYRDILLDDNRFLRSELAPKLGDEIIGGNTGLRNVMEMVQQVAPLSNTVLLMGETGTGKEVIANAIHFASPRKDGPFIKVNCGAIPEGLIDSELFGHEKGAFTGAVTEKRGRFERATGGTIFLDEIGELPPQAQVRLLRVLQQREIERVGGDRPIPVDIRVIAATHRNLESMVTENRFREDLWFRLNVFPIIVPPLRQRREDVPALARHFVMVKCRELGIAIPPAIVPGALERLMNYGWPGNVRELENLVERELIRHRGGQLRFDSLLSDDKGGEFKHVIEGKAAGHISLDEAMTAHISNVLKLTNGKIHGPGGAAELLGINPNTLRGRMGKLGLKSGRRTG
ncbi:GAF sensor sigma-54-dependent transcriptional regulator [Citrifermentans bemidjiense Bem]|uniref:GAF sensor sigma-54-dependent transcriptional regulator n=1 Tax=Citrifermentans bemidjiense (strain ATCC BAA-1014 / DSM 16622 / JCM 12645 / Bem) TaxID=404380 RepID=B5EGP7_CITBB|nr:sigma 54-interacting transcriptional regulator [Citrifermentans bemidjiense]ACH39530.1 GAF sensor sigma-54-dependent transcriptional regulator [Citrifermentans bemidjiense Bem]